MYVYADPYGQVFVNSHRVYSAGDIFYEQGEVYLPTSVAPLIRQSLRPSIQWPPQQSATVIQHSVGEPPVVKVGHGYVMIDPGHGGKDPGTHSAALGINEKTVVLDVGTKLSHDLQAAHVRVAMTRNYDTFVELDERAAMSNREHVDLFVAIHADSAERASANGFTVYIGRNASARSQAAAAAIERAMRSAGFVSQGVRHAGYRVLVANDQPAVLVESGYMSNFSDATRLADPPERSVYARALAAGIANYLNHIP